MASRYGFDFTPIVGTTAPSFNSTLGSSGVYALEATSTGRIWAGGNRAVRLAGLTSTPFYFSVGTASTTTTAAVGDSELVHGGRGEIVPVAGNISHIAFRSSTDVTINVTLGYGGR